MRMLRWVFGMTLADAKEVHVTADGEFDSLDECQEALIPAIEALAKEIAEEEDG